MLAQSIEAVPASTGHEASAKAAGKSRGLAGFFSDLLSQAQKNLGVKGLGAEKGIGEEPHSAASLLEVHRRPGLLGHADLQTANFILASRDRIAGGTSGPESLKRASGQEARVAEAAGSHKPREVRASRHVHDPHATEAGAATAEDGGQRNGTGLGSSAEEAAAIVAASSLAVAKPAPVHANQPRAKASQPGAEEGLSSDAKVERQASEPRVTVLDLRRSSEPKHGAAPKEALKVEAKAEDLPMEAVREARPAGPGTGREVYREFSLGAKAAGDSPAAGKADSGAGQAQDFQSILAERLRDAWNGDIVQSAHIVLKDGDAGTIRMRLRPESLGNVKIELNLSENNIIGRIIVESDAAKSAFERNMNDLADAFRQGGFGSARLEVSVGGGSNDGGRPGGQGADSAGPFFSERLRSAVLSPGDPATAASAYARRGGAVDILA